MYDELVNMLRVCGDSNNSCGNCPIRENDGSCPHGEWEFAAEKYMLQAADAIEELQEDNAALNGTVSNLIQQIAELSKHRWIPVAERLPEKFENVLVANKRGKHYDIDKGWWNGSFFDRCAKGSYSNVTHWMPIPEPPKEE